MKKVLSVLMVFAAVCSLMFANGTGESSGTSKQKLLQLNVAYMPNYASLCTIVAADRMGYFAQEGLAVSLVEFADGPTEISAMESGSIDVAYIGPGAHKLCINGRAKIFALDHVGTADAIIARKSHGITTPADLKGKVVGYASGTSSETILQLTLEKAGLTMKDIKAIEMDASGLTSAMTSGSLDACAAWSPSTTTIMDILGKDSFVLSNNLTFSDHFASMCSWIVMDKYYQQHADIILRFTRALYKGMDYRTSNIEQTSKWVAEKMGADYKSVYAQRGDGQWITGKTLVNQVKDGTVKKLYEVQKTAFGDQVNQKADISDYVLFTNMLDAAK
jgi:NitT/TauT family transport system substrate-binding protein